MGRDLRKYSRQTNAHLLAGFILLLFLLGDGLVYLFYGSGAAVFGFMCLLAGLSPLVIIWIVFVGIDWVVNKANEG
jgi:hypothetical protein